MKNLYNRTNSIFTSAFNFKHPVVFILCIVLSGLFSSTTQAQKYRASTQVGADYNVKTITVKVPTGTVSGDVMIAAICTRPYNVNVTAPKGWNLLLDTQNPKGNGDNVQDIYWRVATAAEPASYTWSFSKSEGSVGGIVSFYNIDQYDPIDVTGSNASSGSSLTFSTPSITTSVPNTMLVAFHCFGSCGNWTTPIGMTQPVDVASNPVPYELGESMCISYGVQAAAGPTGIKTATASAFAEVGISQIISLNPAPTAAISYSAASFFPSGTASVSLTGKTGGTYSSTTGLSINSTTGQINLSASLPGTYTVTYTFGGGYTTTTTVTIQSPTVSATSTPSCVGGSTGTITAVGSGSVTPYSYSLNSGAYQASSSFTGLAAGTYTVNLKTATGSVASATVTVSQYSNSTDDQNATATDSWIGHIYDTKTFTTYYGHFTETENFNETFGGPTNCFNVTSNSQTQSIYTEDFSVKYLMTSSKEGLYVADLGSDEGSRLTVDGTLIYNNWTAHTYATSPRVLMNLTGSSLLKYEYYDNTGANQVSFQNLTLVLANNLTTSTVQSVCVGSSGLTISGDAFGVMPAGITLSGTGYQWSYSTTLGGAKTNIAGATGATFTPSATVAPFNVAGTYYIYRSAIVSSANNTGVSPYTVTNVSNVATVIITSSPSATISYTGSPFCNTGSTSVTLSGTAGGTFTSAGLSINATSGDINLGASTPGSYVVTYTIAATSTCAAFSKTTTIAITGPGVWTGAINTLWQVPGNWKCNSIPTSTSDVLIPTAVPNYPVINNSITGMSNNITIQPGATITVNSGTLQIKGAVTATGANIVATNGKVEFNGTAAQTIPANLFYTNAIKDLVITNAGDVTLAGPLRVTSTVGFGSVNNSVLYSNGYLTLASTSSITADVLDVTNGGVNTGNTISGDVIVERYMQGKRAYRFLTAPVNSTTSIKTNWMEGVNNTSAWVNNNPIPNYGTHITGTGGSANGFDVTQTNNPSLFTFNLARQTWTAATNTSGLFSTGNGFRIIVRGSRSVDLNNNDAVSSVTTLRAKGTLYTGSVTFTKAGGGGTAGTPALSAVTNTYSFIANPYASAVDWSSIIGSNFTDLSPTLYAFDPTIKGSNGRGGYVAFNGLLKVINIPSSSVNKDLQSGQAFFLLTTGPNPSLTFKESYKTTTSLPIFKTANDVPHINIELLLPEQVNGTGSADGTAVYFSDDYSNSIGDDDSYKFTNQDENIAVMANGTPLSLEGRKPLNGSDSIPLKIWQLTQKDYTLKITLDKFSDNAEAYLEDKFLHTSAPLANGENLVPFTITPDVASSASDRFKIVLESFATLPVKLTNIKAYEKNKGVQIDWSAESESNMESYEVQRSSNAQQFDAIGSAKAKNISGITSQYNLFDASPNNGDNFYRIKSTDKSGEITYSEVVKVNVQNSEANIFAAVVAGSSSSFTVNFKNVEMGTYTVNVISNLGQKVYEGKIVHAGGSATKLINVNNALPPGIYCLQLITANNNQSFPLLFQ